MAVNLFPEYAERIKDLSDDEVADPRTAKPLRMDRQTIRGKTVDLIYAPFDHVNTSAHLVIVGLTPGLQQARNALFAAREALEDGETLEDAAELAKSFASFSGEMRGYLVRLLDHIGINKLFRVETTAELWDGQSGLVHFTSAIRYPLFIEGENWSGRPNLFREPVVQEWLERYTGHELRQFDDAILVPLGDGAADALKHLAKRGIVNSRHILYGLPHPSTLNMERIYCFLGHKRPEDCSNRTNPDALLQRREQLVEQVDALIAEKVYGQAGAE